MCRHNGPNAHSIIMKGKVSVLRTDLEQMEMIDSRDTVGLRSPRNSYEIALPTRERRLPWYRRRLSLTTSVAGSIYLFIRVFVQEPIWLS